MEKVKPEFRRNQQTLLAQILRFDYHVHMSNQFQQSFLGFAATTPARRRWYAIASVLAAWTLFGLFMAWQIYTIARRIGDEMTWQEPLRSELVYAYVWALLTPLVLFLGRKFYLERRRLAARLLVHAVAAVAIALLQRILLVTIMKTYRAFSNHQPFSGDNFLTHLINHLDYGILLYGIIIILQHAFSYYRHFQEKTVHAAQLQTQLAQAQLQALRMQLQPHFLFNALNAVSVLISKNPQAARRMLQHLSEFLRLTLQSNGAQLVSLETELNFLECYLQIEYARFGDRLTIARDIAAETLPAQVPNLILQPLVENAVRHGLAAQRGPALIGISTRRDNATLRLQIRDNGNGLEHARDQHRGHGNGIGLTNTRARLQQLYGDRCRLDLRNAEEGGVVATVEIPFQIDV